MNGMSSRGMNGYDAGRPQMLRPAGTPKYGLADGYRQDDGNSYQRDKPRLNPVRPTLFPACIAKVGLGSDTNCDSR
jgi:hypothetical protein